MWSRFAAERLRSKIRRIRDDLFDWMTENQQDYRSEEYRQVRQTLNGIMRLSNTFGPIEFFAMMVIYSTKRSSSSLPPSILADRLTEVKEQAVRVWMHYLFCEGFFGVCVRCLWMTCQAVSMIAQLKSAIANSGEEILHAAYAFGSTSLTRTQKTILAR